MSSQKLNIYLNTLGKNPEYKAIFSHANQLDQIERILIASAAIPKHLLIHCKIGPLSRNQLILLTETASIAAKLKHIAPSIVSKLHQKGWKIASIRVQVQNPGKTTQGMTFQREKQNAPNPSPRISAAGIENLNRLAQTLTDSELKLSIKQLLESQS